MHRDFSFCAALVAGVLFASCSHSSSEALPATASAAAAVMPVGSGGYKTLYNFFPGYDGVWPMSGLTPLNGRLYGTTYGGGNVHSGPCEATRGCGTIYSIGTHGGLKVLHRFAGYPNDGAIPEAGLTLLNGTLYGTTFAGGANDTCAGRGCGAVFAIATSGAERLLYSFEGGSDGSNPAGGLLQHNGVLYGTTTGGVVQRACPNNGGTFGTVFALSTSGAERVLHRFKGPPLDGACPIGNLIIVGKTLYGVTGEGGRNNVGTVFSLTLGEKEHVLYNFTAAGGDYPVGIVFVKNTLYGATSADGPDTRGTIFSLTLRGRYAVVHSFKGNPTGDGALPYAPPILLNGKLYGTTEGGGTSGIGTAYELNPVSRKERVLHDFGPLPDGIEPADPLLALNGELYGTTTLGGTHDDCSLHGTGTVFALSPSASPSPAPSPSPCPSPSNS